MRLRWFEDLEHLSLEERVHNLETFLATEVGRGWEPCSNCGRWLPPGKLSVPANLCLNCHAVLIHEAGAQSPDCPCLHCRRLRGEKYP